MAVAMIGGGSELQASRGTGSPRARAPSTSARSHLIRDLTAHSEGLAAQKAFGEGIACILTLSQTKCHMWVTQA
jgi:hypothetical protein